MLLHDLYKKHGRLNRRLHHIEQEMRSNMTQIDEVTQAVETLKNDLATKFGEIDSEFTQVESEKSEGKEPDLSGLKTLISEADDTVKNHTLPAPATPSGGEGSGGAPSPEPSGGAPSPEPSGEPGGEAPRPSGSGAANQSLYVFSGEGTPDPSVWPTAPFETEDGQQLYYFHEDVPGDSPPDTKGEGSPNWTLYSGTPKAQA